MRKYYEIVGNFTNSVIGVTSADDNDDLVSVVEEDSVAFLGEITKEQFEKYGDDTWVKPISTVRWSPSLKTTVVLEPL